VPTGTSSPSQAREYGRVRRPTQRDWRRRLSENAGETWNSESTESQNRRKYRYSRSRRNGSSRKNARGARAIPPIRRGASYDWRVGSNGEHRSRRPSHRLNAHRLWGPISDAIEMLRERKDVGRALDYEDERKLICGCGKSRSPMLLPLLTITFDTGCAPGRFDRCVARTLVSFGGMVIARIEIVLESSAPKHYPTSQVARAPESPVVRRRGSGPDRAHGAPSLSRGTVRDHRRIRRHPSA